MNANGQVATGSSLDLKPKAQKGLFKNNPFKNKLLKKGEFIFGPP